MHIYYKNTQKDLKVSSRSVKLLVSSILKKLKISADEISIQFVSTKKICKLHEDFFEDPTTTDCITFPIDEDHSSGYRVLGEVFVCPKTALEYCKKNDRNPYVETSLYVVHGILHLLGYDDIDPKDRKLMRKKERQCMDFLHSQNLILSEKLVV